MTGRRDSLTEPSSRRAARALARRDSFDKDELPVGFIIAKGSGRLTKQGSRRRRTPKSAASRKADSVRMKKYWTGSTQWTLPAKTYTRVEAVDVQENQLTVTRPTGEPVTYDPRRLQGVTLYREEERPMAVGDRAQCSSPHRFACSGSPTASSAR